MATAAKKISPKAESTELTQVTPPLTPMESQAAQATGATDVVASDVLIPRLLLGQGISPMVTSRKAQIGDFVRSTTFEKLGDPEHPVEIVPLKMTNSWISFEKVAGQNKPQFRGMESRNGSNEHLPWEYKGPKGEAFFRRKAITLYALIPSDVAAYEAGIKAAIESGEAPDLDKTVLPVVITFQSTSFKHGGKKCASFFNTVQVNQMRLAGKMDIAPFQYVLPLIAKEEKQGDAAWYVYDFGQAKALKDPAIRAEAARWAMLLGKSDVKIDENLEAEESGGSSGVTEMEV